MSGRAQQHASYGGAFDKDLSHLLGPTCGTIYVALPETQPRDKVDRVLKVLNNRSCTSLAVVRRNLTGLPSIEPSDGMRQHLQRLLSAKPGVQQDTAQASFGLSVVRQHGKSCGSVTKLVDSLGKVSGYKKYELVMGELAAKPTGYRDCACSLPGDDDKVLFQFLTFSRRGSDMSVYEARRLPPGVAAMAKSAKIWYEFVRTLSP
jgi:hypothetical protein